MARVDADRDGDGACGSDDPEEGEEEDREEVIRVHGTDAKEK